MSEQVIVIIISGGDIASTNQAESLLMKCKWTTGPLVEGFRTWNCNSVRLWWRDGGVLFEDNLDIRWENVTTERVSEVIFPSRHVAASGLPCLTIHPIEHILYFSGILIFIFLPTHPLLIIFFIVSSNSSEVRFFVLYFLFISS